MDHPSLQQEFVPTLGKKRSEVLAEILKVENNSGRQMRSAREQNGTACTGEKTLIFTNSVDSCKQVQAMLLSEDFSGGTAAGARFEGGKKYSVHALHSSMHHRSRARVVKEFMKSAGSCGGGGSAHFAAEGPRAMHIVGTDAQLGGGFDSGLGPTSRTVSVRARPEDASGDALGGSDDTAPQRATPQQQRDTRPDPTPPQSLPQHQILVATNLASRGLDIPGITHVINFDLPRTVADYLHRVGRTARMGKTGKVSTIMGRKNLHLVRQIQDQVSQIGVKAAS